MSKQPLGLATPAAQPRGDDHPFLTKAPAADPTKSPSNRSRLGYFTISDHLPVEYKSTFQDGTQVKILTWNMMNKCTDSAENAVMGGFSNNQYNFSEKKNESSYAARIEKEKLFLTQKLSPSSHDRPDFVNLQEVNGLTSIDKGDTPIIKKSFLQEMDKLGYGALYSKSRNLNAKPLITLYRTDRYALKNIDFVMPDAQGRETLMLSNFINRSSSNPIVIGNAHLDYKADPAIIKSVFAAIKAQHPKFLATGDMNHNHTAVGGISDGKATTFDAVINPSGQAVYTQQTTTDARNSLPKTYDSLIASNNVTEVAISRDFTLEQRDAVSSGELFVQCVVGEVKTSISIPPQQAFAVGGAAAAAYPSASRPIGSLGATASAATSSPLENLAQALTKLIAQHKVTIEKPKTFVPLTIKGTVYNLSQTKKAGSTETVYYLTTANPASSPKITISVSFPSKPIIKSELHGNTILYGEGPHPVTGEQLVSIDKSPTILQLVNDIASSQRPVMAAASADPSRPWPFPIGSLSASAIAASNTFITDFDQSNRQSLYGILDKAIPAAGNQKESGRFKYAREKDGTILCTVTNLKTVDIIRLNPHQETTYEVNVNTGAPIQADDRRFKRAIGYIAEQIGIKLSDASRSYPRS